MKKLLSILLSLLLLCACLPLGAIPVSAATSGTTGDCRWRLDGTKLTIFGNGRMENYYSSSSLPWGENIISVTIEDGVTTIGYGAFYFCDSLTSVTIGDSVTTIGDYAFRYCGSLTSVTIGDSVTTIGDGAFGFCSSLTSVTIPDSVTTIEKEAFVGCHSLTSVTIPDSVITIDDAFSYCTSLTDINTDENNPNYSSLDGVLFNKEQTTLIQYPGGKSGHYTIPDGVTTICEEAFGYCYYLTSVTIPNSVTSIGNSAFEYCRALTLVTIGDGVTTIGGYAFDNNCASLTAIDVDENNPNYSSVEGVLFNKEQTTLITCPGKKTGTYIIPDSVTTIGKRAFSGCRSLTSVTIPDSVTTIGEDAFFWCTSLTSVTIPDSVTTIGDSAFYHCFNLTSVIISAGITTISDRAFDWCTSLMSVTIPDSVTAIGDSAFNDCDSLTEVYYGGSVQDRTAMSIGSWNSDLTAATWHYNYMPITYGDADGDGSINTRDVALLQQYIAGWDVTLNEVSADANGDGAINARDLALLQQYIAGWDVTLGPV